MTGTRIATFALACLASAALVSAQTAGPAPGESLSQSYRGSQARNVEYQKIAPFKVMDNLYYVGPGSVVGVARADQRGVDPDRHGAGAVRRLP